MGTYENNTGLYYFPYSIYNYKYVDDLLLIRAADNNKEKIFKVTPLYKEQSDYIIKDYDFQSNNFIIGLIVKLSGDRLFFPTLILLNDSQENIKIETQNDKLNITVKENIIKIFENDIKRQNNQ